MSLLLSQNTQIVDCINLSRITCKQLQIALTCCVVQFFFLLALLNLIKSTFFEHNVNLFNAALQCFPVTG